MESPIVYQEEKKDKGEAGDHQESLVKGLSKMQLLEQRSSTSSVECDTASNSLSSDDSGVALTPPPHQPPLSLGASLNLTPASSVTYSPYVNGSIFSVPKSWSVTDNGENLVVSVYAFVKSYLG